MARPDLAGARELYIFVTSARPDPYVNVLVHALQEYAITAVHYIAIIEHNYTAEQMNKRLADIEIGVGRLLEQLACGFYGDRMIEVDPRWIIAYKECNDKLDRISVRRVPVPWNDLDGELKKYIASGTVMFDVTTLKKNLLVDVVALLLSRGFTAIFTFDVTTSSPPEFDERGLIHALGPDFRYRSLAESRHVEQAKSRLISRSITIRTLFLSTSVVGLVVFVIQLFFPNTVLESIIVALGTTAAIAGLIAGFLRGES
jgi:hypothetical protein